MSAAPELAPVIELQGRLDRLNSMKLADTYRELGLEPPSAPERHTSWERVTYQMDGRGEVLALKREADGVLIDEGVQPAIGKPGTKLIDGRIEVEQNFRLRPYQARGRLSNPGLFEETYRVEPVAFKNVNEIAALICNATYEPEIAEDTPAELKAEVQRQHRAIRRAMFNADFLQNGSSFLKNGFAFFEVGWHEKDMLVDWFEFREPSTLERWLFDDRQSEWLGTEFRTGGGIGSESYIIPNGRELWSARSLLINLHAQGNNLEGISPLRIVVGLRKLKELILQAFGVGYTKYAVPIATIVQELTEASAAIIAQFGATGHKGEVQELINRLAGLRSRLGAVLPVPAGWKVEFQNPTRDMPDPTALLNYIDTMIALVFANEGALLGSQSFGSYAMAAKSDEKFMRAAPAYAQRIALSLTKLLHVALEFNGFDLREVEELPVYSFRFNGTQDASAWLKDVVAVMSANPARFPTEVRRATAARLGLKADAFDGAEAVSTDGETAQPLEGEDLQRSALNGAQVIAMVEVVQQVASGMLPAESGIRILMRAFQMGRSEAEALVNPAKAFEQADEQTEATE